MAKQSADAKGEATARTKLKKRKTAYRAGTGIGLAPSLTDLLRSGSQTSHAGWRTKTAKRKAANLKAGPERAYKKCKERLGSNKDAWKKDTACRKAHIAWKKHKSSSATDSVSGRKGKKRFGKNKFRAADRKDWSQAAEEEAMDLPLDEEGYEEDYEEDYEDEEEEGTPMWMMAAGAAGGLGLLWFLSGR